MTQHNETISDAIPAERLYGPSVKQGTRMHLRGIGEVVESKSANYKKGDTVVATIGYDWLERVRSRRCKGVAACTTSSNGLAISHYVGTLGATGVTAYYGLKVIKEAMPSDRVIVSGAAGSHRKHGGAHCEEDGWRQRGYWDCW
jgi:NADPH-dependent curcumin reductase CurA